MRPGALDYKPRVQVATSETLGKEAVSCVLRGMQVIPIADERAIALRLKLAPATLSFHLKELANAGLVTDHRWLSEQQFVDCVALGIISPGPVVIIGTAAGYVDCGDPARRGTG